MARVGEIMGFGIGLQGGGGTATATATATLVELLRESINGSDCLIRRKTFKVRMGFKGCCGTTWGFGPSSNIRVMDDDEDEQMGRSPEDGNEIINVGLTVPENGSRPSCAGDVPASSGMNLAAALAAERQFRAVLEFDETAGFSQSPIRASNNNNNNNNNDDVVRAGTESATGTPLRVSLMKLLEETEGCDEEETEKGVGSDSMCCVCMRRKKGAAFIPCGHTYCRVCSRELWLNRGLCPLCNRSIQEVLDIF